MTAEFSPAQGVLTPTSPLREVWPDGLVPLRVYAGRKVFDLARGKIVESGTVHALELATAPAEIREQLAVLMASRWGWDYRQALLLLEADGELPITEAEHLVGIIFKGRELEQTQTREG